MVQKHGHNVSHSRCFVEYINMNEQEKKVSLQSKIEDLKLKQIPRRITNSCVLRVVGWCKGRLVPAEGLGASLSVVAD
jgi:hypothetical protein